MSKVINQDSQETFFISTVTMSFNPMEDRVVMDSSDKNEKVERLWLSRRLLDRLIPSLTDQLEVKSSNEIPTEMEHSLAQEKADLDKQEDEPVKMKIKNPSWLVTSIQIRRSESNFQLVFLGENTEVSNITKSQAKFDLATTNLRQWLNAVYKIYLKAEWETKAFPPWLKESSSKSNKPILLN